MRIAYVTETYPPELNGVALGVERVVSYLRGRGHEVDLLRPAQRGERPAPAGGQEWLCTGCPIPVYPELRFGLASAAAVARRLQERQAELVHIATPGPLAWAAVRAARKLGLALSSDFRTNFHQYSRYYGLGLLSPLVEAGLRQLHNRTQRTFVPSRSAYRQLAAQGFRHLQLLGRGVDADRFSPAWRCEALRAEWRAGRGPVLLHVGRLAAEKNVELALRAHALLSRARPDCRMIVVGDGPLRARLERRYPAARFLGVLRGEALSRAYASADAFLFPSLSDTFGNVTLEAMASGLPVLAFNTAAAADLIVPRLNGFLATVGDDTAFLDGALRFAAPPAVFNTMRLQARRTALQQHLPELLARFEMTLQQLCEERPLAAALQMPAV